MLYSNYNYTGLPLEISGHVTPRYNFGAMRDLWRKYIDSYVGGIAYQNGDYLIRLHRNESIDDFVYRKKLSIYDNQCKRVVNNIITKIWNRDPVRIGLDSVYDFIEFKDFDNRVVSVNNFFKLVDTYQLVLGEVFVIIDHPYVITEDGYISNLDRKENNIKYCAQTVLPIFVPSLEMDADGTIQKALVETNEAYILWTNEEKTVWLKDEVDGKIEIIQQPTIANPFGVVPVIRYTIDMNSDSYGDSLLADIADINKNIYNIDSIQIADLFNNSQNVLLLPMNAELAQNYQEWSLVNKETGKLDILGKSVLPHAESAEPKYLIKDLTYHEHLERLRGRFVEAIDRLSNQTIQRLVEQSGISKSFDADNANQNLKSLSYIFENFENEFWMFFIELAGIDLPPDSVEISYTHDFDIIDKNKRLQNLIDVRDVIDNIEVHRAIDKIIVRDQLSEDLTTNEMKDIIDAIDKGYDTEEDVMEHTHEVISEEVEESEEQPDQVIEEIGEEKIQV